MTTINKATNQTIKKPPFYITKFKWLVFLLFFLALLGFYFLLILPQYHSYLSNQENLEQSEHQLETSMNSLSRNREIINNYQAINQIDKEKIDQILPNQPELSDLYVNLQSLVKQNRLDLESLIISNLNKGVKKVSAKQPLPTTLGNLESMEINLSLSGVNYLKMKEFFSVLEANLRLFDVNSFDFNPQSGHLNIVFKTYYIN